MVMVRIMLGVRDRVRIRVSFTVRLRLVLGYGKDCGPL